MEKRVFHLYGDNMVECERIFDLLISAIDVTSYNRYGNASNITLSCSSSIGEFNMIYFPGFGRWTSDVIKYFRDSGGVLREAPDCIMTEVFHGGEKPIFAVEFCSALDAGNQAWQRSGRAYSSAKSGLPYIFLTEIGGYELNPKTREKKVPRLPSPAIPFSYISYSKLTSTPVLPVYIFSPGADIDKKKKYMSSIGMGELNSFIKAIFNNSKEGQIESELDITNKCLSFVKSISSDLKSHTKKYTPQEWGTLYDDMENAQLLDLIVNNRRIDWKKKFAAKSNITTSAKNIMKIASCYGQGISAGDLPICVIPSTKVSKFIEDLNTEYEGNLPCEFINGLTNDNHLAICWINGFKPKGDDSRPDRGLLPFLRMLVGDDAIVLTVVFGAAKEETWKTFDSDINKLITRNGLWEAILNLSNYTLIDSYTLEKSFLTASRNSYLNVPSNNTKTLMEVNSNHFPIKYGENDVDTLIHLYFKNLLSKSCFEGMCNPPGGDWSGVSITVKDNEYRWLSLPRVSQSKAKRPDHVIQFPGTGIVLSVESKDYLSNLESNIGLDLNRYTKDLIGFEPNASRPINSRIDEWTDDISSFNLPNLKYLSAAAYIEKSERDLNNAKIKSGCDIIMGVRFDDKGKAKLTISSNSLEGDNLVTYMKENLENNPFNFKVIFNNT